ncbi:MAG: sulfate transporter family protein [Rhodoblastus sp.]|nr:MAG: sulfate transporter family protein [Rhodoblastus sp.]
MFEDVSAAFNQVWTPPLRAVLFKTVGLTLALLALAWLGIEYGVAHWVVFERPWLNTLMSWLLGVGLFLLFAYLLAPISLITAGLFLDEAAEAVERSLPPDGAVGRPISTWTSAVVAARFGLVSLGVNVAALALLLVPGVNIAAFFAANAYLMSREYFELAAMRFRGVDEAHALRRANALTIFLYGLPIAAVLTVPVLNLTTPVFGVALMTRLHRRLSSAPPP